jgi:DNA-binding transcriptional LysR family regulator
MALNIDLAAVRAFVAVAREGTMARAAEKLHLTQPAVSLQIKALQERTGLALFNRSGRGLTLSRDGAALLPLAEKVLGSLGEFGEASQRLRSSVRGRLRIGTILDPEFTRLGAFLKTLVELAPQVETELSQHISGIVRERIEHGELDVGFYLAAPDELASLHGKTPAPSTSNPYFYEGNMASARMESAQSAIKIVVIELTRFNYRVLAPPGWGSLVSGRDWRALADLPWIITPPASVHHRLLRDALQPLGLSIDALRRAALVDQEASMLDLVRSGVGLSLARDTVAMREAQSRALVVADRVELPCVLCFIHAEGREDSAVQAARQALRRVWA